MKLQAQFCLLRLVFFLFYCSLCEPKQLTGYEFPVYTTNMCPRDETEWSQRSSSINCTKSNSYICIPNENRTELLEFCYIYPTTWINKGVCLYLIKRYSRVDSYKCNTFEYGCPNITYKATQLIHYKSCVSIGNGCFLAEPLCKKEWRDDTTDYEQTTQNIDIDIYRVKDYAILGIVISIWLILSLIIVYVCCRRGKFSKSWKNADCKYKPLESNDEELRFDQWREDDVSFFSTRACKKVDSKIKTQNLVIVTGHSGSGKSAIIQHIALKYLDQKWIVKLFKDVRKMIKYILEQECSMKSMKSTILVLNDPIGKDSFDKAAYLSWKESEQAILTFLEKGKLICSCRNYILFDNKVKGVLKNKTNIVNIEDVECKLTNEEKRCIWSNYITNANISEEDFDKILNIEAYFPLLCKLFSCDIKYQKDGYRFFKEPVEVVEEQIRCFREEDREKYCALVLLVLFNNFCADDVVRNDLLGNNFKRALTMCGLPQDTPPYKIVDNLDLLNGFLVKKIGDAYEFNHDFIMEVTSFIFGKDYPSGFIQYADIRFLLRRVTLDNGIEQNRSFTIYLSDSNIYILGERLFKAIFEECYMQVILHPALRDKRLINVLQKEFERHPEKLQELLQNKKSMHDDQKLYWPIADDTMSKLAFVALKNEFSPLCALVAFCHTDLSLYCFHALRKSKSGLIGKKLVSAVCLHGSRDFLKMFPDKYVKHSLKEKIRGLFPIHITALFYNFEILQKLIELGAYVNMKSKDKNSWTPLMFAASRDKNDPQENDYNMDTSIRRDKTVQILIDYKADVNFCTGDGVSSLFLACQNGHISMVEILLSNGAYINQCTKNGESPLFIACQEGHNDIVQFLLEKEADINLRTAEDEISPLYIACENGHESTVQTLLDHGADVNSCTITGASPLFIACQKGYNSCVQLLIGKGAAVNMCRKNGASPLYIAFQKDHISTVKLLLSNGADKTSPLFKACKNGNEKLIQLLLDNGADINICDETGVSPLFLACQKGHHAIVQLLLTNGATIDLC